MLDTMPRPAPGLHARTELSLLAFMAGEWKSRRELMEHLRLSMKDVSSLRAFHRLVDSVKSAGVVVETKRDTEDARRVLYRAPAWASLRSVFMDATSRRRRKSR